MCKLGFNVCGLSRQGRILHTLVRTQRNTKVTVEPGKTCALRCGPNGWNMKMRGQVDNTHKIGIVSGMPFKR